MAQAVILEHRLDDGSVHFDWMIEDASIDADHRLRTWRVAVRPDGAGVLETGFVGERIGDHRAAYLRFEGEIGDARGRVRRLRSGEVVLMSMTDQTLSARIRWDAGRAFTYVGTRDLSGDGWWQFGCRAD